MATQVGAVNAGMTRAEATPAEPRPILSDEMLARFERRAPEYDRENRFCTEDFEELRDAGYLTMAVPAELAGTATRWRRCSEQRRRLRGRPRRVRQ